MAPIYKDEWKALEEDIQYAWQQGRRAVQQTVVERAKVADDLRRYIDLRHEDWERGDTSIDFGTRSIQQLADDIIEELEDGDFEYALEEAWIEIGTEWGRNWLRRVILDSFEDPRQEPLPFEARTRRSAGWGDEEEYPYPTEDELHENVVIEDAGTPMSPRGYVAYHANDEIARADDWDGTIAAVLEWAEQDQFWPDLFYVNERGNIDLLRDDGSIIHSWV